jgi:hypothetical protein
VLCLLTYLLSGARGGEGEYSLTCASFHDYCGDEMSGNCYESSHSINNVPFSFSSLEHFHGTCMECEVYIYVHTTLIFNAFVFCQICNEFNARSIFDDVYIFSGITSNPIFMAVIFVTVILQYLIVTYGGDFTRTSPLTTDQWLQTIGFGLIAFPVGKQQIITYRSHFSPGFIMRFIPVQENPEDFFTDSISESSRSSFSPSQRGE